MQGLVTVLYHIIHKVVHYKVCLDMDEEYFLQTLEVNEADDVGVDTCT